MLQNIIVALIIVLILGGVILYIIREKKKGTKCIGCESGKSCGCHSSEKSSHGKE